MVSNAYYTLDPRLRRQAEALAAHGYQVEVLCQRESREPPEEYIHGVLVRRIGGLKYRGQSVRSYLLANASFFLRAFVALARGQLQHGYAAVQVYSMPEALLFTALLPRALGVPLIYDAGDLTTELYSTKFGSKANRLVAALLRAQERICLRFADLIVTVHEEYRRRLLARQVPPHRSGNDEPAGPATYRHSAPHTAVGGPGSVHACSPWLARGSLRSRPGRQSCCAST